MIKITVIGSGNVAQHLIKIISKSSSLDLVQIVVRNALSVIDLISSDKICVDYDKIQPADLYIIAVSDNAIEIVAAKLPFKNRLVVHTSGSMGLEKLDNKYIDFESIPICLEADTDLDYILLQNIAEAISNKVYKINAEQRKALHVSAVFVCNFVNHLYKIGNEICDENQIPFEILYPLIQETAKKIEILSPTASQTGPAKRQDIETINSHLKFLSNENQKDIYKILTKSIIDNGT